MEIQVPENDDDRVCRLREQIVALTRPCSSGIDHQSVDRLIRQLRNAEVRRISWAFCEFVGHGISALSAGMVTGGRIVLKTRSMADSGSIRSRSLHPSLNGDS